MSGFWAAGPSWASWVIVGCLCLLALLVGGCWGAWWGGRRGWDQAVEEQRWRRAQARPPAVLPPLIVQEDPASLVFWRSLDLAEDRARDWEAHPAAAVALVRPDLTDSAYTQDMGERMDRFLAGLCGVPYSADELWSGQ